MNRSQIQDRLDHYVAPPLDAAPVFPALHGDTLRAGHAVGLHRVQPAASSDSTQAARAWPAATRLYRTTDQDPADGSLTYSARTIAVLNKELCSW